ncbi:hypothetical protein [Rhodococcus sp. B50]|uniref:hypothetical protein n=1 Tax=Rhodococcus sp. B50 TaxID=2682847 RepID=UPI001BD2D1B0|nr:hypothetical protein [Rhodococcus sp. B50]MBS9375500.1 hypothetical protein [Rhodococcus sp. B50]
MRFGGITKDGRAHVHLELKRRDDVKPAPEGGVDVFLTVRDPLPPVCPLHGEPEVRTLRTWVTTKRKTRHTRGQIRILGAETAAKAHTFRSRSKHCSRHITVRMPLCRRCVVVNRVARGFMSFFLGLSALLLLVAVIIGAVGAAPDNAALFTMAFFGGLWSPALGLGVSYIRQGWLGLEAPIDASVLVVADAHPNFVRAFESGRAGSPPVPAQPYEH